MADKRVTRVAGEFHRTFETEDGVNYRGEHQEMDPVIAHIKYLNEKVNGAPAHSNKNGWRYLGSTTPVLMTHWCQMVGVSHNDFATQPELRAAHMAWLNKEFSKLSLPKKKNSMIVVS